MNKYKKQLESIARDTKESDQDLQKEIIAKVLKEENVKVTDDAFKNVLTPFTMETANTNTSESKTKSTKSSESKTTESTKTSESSTTESSSK